MAFLSFFSPKKAKNNLKNSFRHHQRRHKQVQHFTAISASRQRLHTANHGSCWRGRTEGRTGRASWRWVSLVWRAHPPNHRRAFPGSSEVRRGLQQLAVSGAHSADNRIFCLVSLVNSSNQIRLICPTEKGWVRVFGKYWIKWFKIKKNLNFEN